MQTTTQASRATTMAAALTIAAGIFFAPTRADAGTGGVIPTSERNALIALYLASNGDGWTNNTGWCSGICPATGTPTFNAAGTECSWFGVQCDATNSHVVHVDLYSNNLQGGPLPDLTPLTALQWLRLYDNQLTGPLPDLRVLTALSQYAMFNNGFSGPVPANLAAWPALTVFQVNNNALTGTLPSLNGASQLQFFEVENNALSGTLPDLTGLAQLQYLDVDSNQFTGSVPSLAGLNQLTHASFSNNQLSGGFPDLAGATALGFLDLSSNRLGGALPGDLSGAGALTSLHVEFNQFTGGLPLPPASLQPHQSNFCPNPLSLAASPNDAAWNDAVGQTPWWGPAGGGCDGVTENGFEVLTNGSFEHGIAGWHVGSGACSWQTASEGVFTSGYGQFAAPTPRDGTYTLVSDDEDFGVCTLYQDVTVPAGASSASVSAAVGYSVYGSNSAGCSAALDIVTPAGTLIQHYVTLTGTTHKPLTQYAPLNFAVQPGATLRVQVTVTNACPDYPAGIQLDNVNLSLP